MNSRSILKKRAAFLVASTIAVNASIFGTAYGLPISLTGSDNLIWNNATGITKGGESTDKLGYLSPTVSSPTEITNLKVKAIAVYTNNPGSVDQQALKNALSAINVAIISAQGTIGAGNGVTTINFQTSVKLTSTTKVDTADPNTKDSMRLASLNDAILNPSIIFTIADGAVLTISGNVQASGYSGAINVGGGGFFVQNGGGSVIYDGNKASEGGGVITIQASGFEQNKPTNRNGAGMAIFGDNAIFRNNEAIGSGTGLGGVAYNFGLMSFGNNTLFENNTANFGGALFGQSGMYYIGNNAIFSGNSGVGNYLNPIGGGAIYAVQQSNIVIGTNALFKNNKATNRAAGAIALDASVLTLNSGTVFTGNSAKTDGGAIYITGMNSSTYQTILNLITDSAGNAIQFYGNTDSSGANSIYFKGGTTNVAAVLNVSGNGKLDMLDPMRREGLATSVAVNQSGGTWYLAGTNDFAPSGSNRTTFSINGGELYLYGAGEDSKTGATDSSGIVKSTLGVINIGGALSSFNLGTGATLTAGGMGNAIDVSTGAIVLNSGTIQGNTGETSLTLKAASTTIASGQNLKLNSTVASDLLTLNADLAGAGQITKTGNGTVVLTGTNTYSGTTTINSGTLQIGAAGTTGTLGTGNVVNNAALTFNRSNEMTVANAISGTGVVNQIGAGTTILTGTNTYSGTTIISNGTLQIGNGGTTGTLGTGNIVNNAALTFDRSDEMTVSNVISGTGVVNQIGAGTTILTGTNTYSGATTISNGTLSVSSSANLGDASATNNIVMNGGTLLATASFDDGRSVILNTGKTGTFSIVSGATLTQSGVISGDGQLVKTNSGRMVLTGTNTYSGTTTISAGTLQISNGGTTGTLGSGNVVNNAALIFDRSNEMTVSNVISGTGTIDQNGAGTTILTGNNTYTGKTTISNGILQVGNGGTTGTLGVDGDVVNNATLIFNRSDKLIVSGSISGTGEVKQVGAGTTILTGTNTYSGTTTISNGTLQIGNGGTTGTLGTGNVVNNAALTFNRSDDLTISGAISGTGVVNQIGAGSTTLNGTNTYTGATTVDNGALYVGDSAHGLGSADRASITSDVTVNTGAVFGGYGQVTGDILVNTGATLTAGTQGGAGQLDVVGNVNFKDVSVFDYDYDQVNGSDLLNVNGSVNIESGSKTYVNIESFTSDGNVEGTKQTMIHTTGGVAGDDFILTIGGNAITSVDFLQGFSSGVEGNDYVLNLGILSWYSEAFNTNGESLAHGNFTLDSGSFTLGTVLVDRNDITPNAFGWDGTTLNKKGAGTLVLTGDNTYSGTTTIEAGTLQIGNGGTSGTLGIGNVVNNGTLSFNRSDDVSVANVINGSGGVKQIGAGTTVLTVNNTYAGTTTISNGTLSVSNSNNLGNGSATNTIIMDGGTLLATASFDNNRDVTLNTSKTGTFSVVAGETLTQSGAISGSGNLVKTGDGTVVLTGNNTYSGSTTISTGVLQVGNGGTSGTLGSGNVVNNAALVFNRSNALIVSSAISGPGVVNQIGAGTTILTGTNTYSGTTTISDGTLQIGNGGTTGTLGTGNVVNNSMLVFNRSDELTVSNAISGTGDVNQVGTGTTVLTGNNTYSGTTTISDGTLQIGNGGTAGTLGTGNVVNDGTLAFNRSDTVSVSNVISGSGDVKQSGPGTTILTAVNTYTGLTTVENGTLVIGDNTSTSAKVAGDVNVLSGATLSGTGTIGGAVNNSGLIVSFNALGGHENAAPSNLNVADLTNSGIIQLAGGSVGNTLTVNGNYIGSNGSLIINTALGNNNSPTDMLIISGDTSGNTSVEVINRDGLGALTTGNGIEVISVGGVSAANAFALKSDYQYKGQNAVVGGAYSYSLYHNGVGGDANDGNWYLRSLTTETPPVNPTDPTNPVNPEVPTNPEFPTVPSNPVYQPGVALYEVYPQVLQQMNKLGTLEQRVGNRTWLGQHENGVDVASITEGRGFWMKVEGSTSHINSNKSKTNANYDLNIVKTQLGLDFEALDNDKGTLIGGVYFQYGHAKADISSRFGKGDIKTDGYGLGGTLTWYGNNGLYVDGVAQAMWYKSDINSDTLDRREADGNKGTGYALSIEAGKKIALNQEWTLTPQAQLSYNSVDFDSFRDAYKARVSREDGDALTGRLGVSLDRETAWKSAAGDMRRLKAYGIANLYYEFLDGTQVQVTGVKFRNQPDRFWGGLGAGLSHNWNDDKYSIYGEVDARSSFNDFGDSYSLNGTVGFKAKF